MSFILCENCGKILYNKSAISNKTQSCSVQFIDDSGISDEFIICKDCYNKLRSQVAENYRKVHDAVRNATYGVCDD